MIGRNGPLLRDQFSDATVPIDLSLVETHHLDYYLATDASFDSSSGMAGYGIIVESAFGERLVALSTDGFSADSTEAEYRAFITGLTELFEQVGPGQRIGVVVDRPDIARATNKFTTFLSCPSVHDSGIEDVPALFRGEMRAFSSQITASEAFRVRFVDSESNPAHHLAHRSLQSDSSVSISPNRTTRVNSPLSRTRATADD